MIDSKLEYELIKLKLKAAEAARLQSRRAELIEVFNKLNLDLPDKVKLHLESITNLTNGELEEKLITLSDENISLLTDLYLFNKMEDIGDMIKIQNLKLKEDIEFIKNFINENPDDGSILQIYLQIVHERLTDLEKQKSQIQDEVIMKDCRLDIITSKLTHLHLQLQEPIQELRLKVENDIPITNEEYLILKIAEKAIYNSKLKARIDELKILNTKLHKKLLQLQEEMLRKIENISKARKQTVSVMHEYFLTAAKDMELASSSFPTVASSYSLDIYKTDSDIKPLAVALLGYHMSELCKTHQQLEGLRKLFYDEYQHDEHLHDEYQHDEYQPDEILQNTDSQESFSQ